MQPQQPIRLSQLTATISETLTNAFERLNFWVIADVTNHSFRTDKNYHNFDLVEKDPASNALIAKMQAKAWGKGAISISNFQSFTGQRFTNNINVLVNVSVNFHPVFGLQLNVNQIDVNFTLGRLEQERLATLDRLVRENPDFIRALGDGYHTKNKELSLNKVIQNIAVVSSRTSAGWQDFRHTLENNPFNYSFAIDDYFTIVQGENNAQQFVSRLIDIFNSQKQYDVVVIIRGGGAQTDFLIFDNYNIGKAIAKFPIPVITGIGHQKNETIADLMAHTQTKTPTKVAEFIIGHNRTFEEAIQRLQKGIVIKAQQKLSTDLQALSQMNSNIVNKTRSSIASRKDQLYIAATAVLTKPRVIVYNRLNDIRQVASNLNTFSVLYIKNQKNYLGHLGSMIKVLSPENTLKRGFAIIKTNDRVTSNPEDLVIGKDLEIILSNKSITSTVKSKKDYDGNDFAI